MIKPAAVITGASSGIGKSLAIELSDKYFVYLVSRNIKKLENNRLLTIRAAENVIRIFPPLTVKKKEIDLAIKIIKKVCKIYKQ